MKATLCSTVAAFLFVSAAHAEFQEEAQYQAYVRQNIGGYVPVDVRSGRGGIHCEPDNNLPSCDNPGDRFGGGGG